MIYNHDYVQKRQRGHDRFAFQPLIRPFIGFYRALKAYKFGQKGVLRPPKRRFYATKKIHSTISRYDIGFRTTLQKTTRKKTKNNMLGSARNRGKSGKIGRLHPSDVRFSTRIPVRKCSEQEQTQKTGPFPFRMSFFPLKSRIIG